MERNVVEFTGAKYTYLQPEAYYDQVARAIMLRYIKFPEKEIMIGLAKYKEGLEPVDRLKVDLTASDALQIGRALIQLGSTPIQIHLSRKITL